MNNNHFSPKIITFRGRTAPEQGRLVGYGTILEAYKLDVPVPDVLSLVSPKKRKYTSDEWQVFTPRYLPENNLYKHLVFALKYEGINLLIFKKLFEKIPTTEVIEILNEEPTGLYSRKIWFLYEWLLNKKLSIPDLQMGNYVPLLDKNIQYSTDVGEKSSRHRIINNLPGSQYFCPLIRKTPALEKHIAANYGIQKDNYLSGIRKDILQRASAFLLLKDSKASFTIEGESPKSKRAARWGQAIGQAGSQDLTLSEFLRLQQIVIENPRFLEMGLRKKGGFVGEHDRNTGEPLPDHISAKWQDIKKLVDGLISTNDLLVKNQIDAVLAASIIAFGFVFIHPFEDGNGRIHRYLIHHVLAKKHFSKQGIIFPVSASILDHINDYRKVLESYSHPLLDLIEWKETKDHNIEVINDTIDYYSYFDATKQAEFLYNCVVDTLENIIPKEVLYLTQYDEFKKYLEEDYEMPDKMIATLVRFLQQNNGILSKRAQEKEFKTLIEKEVKKIEVTYKKIFFEI